MSLSCLNILSRLANFIDDVNGELTKNMTETSYDLVCAKPNVSYDFYFDCLSSKWEKAINDFIQEPPRCNLLIPSIAKINKYANYENLVQMKELLKIFDHENNKISIDEIVLETIATNIMRKPKDLQYKLKENFMDNIVALVNIMIDHCQCQLIELYKYVLKKYNQKYKKKFIGKSKEQIINMVRTDYANFKRWLKTINPSNFNRNSFYYGLDTLLQKNFFSIESELDTLIPDELGSMKKFFIKIITTYYTNLHPIIWAQIFKSIIENVFIELPFTSNEIFSFVSKHLLLNSGPFILKILQIIRPVLSPEIMHHYNLSKLTYPLLKINQVKLILRSSIIDYNMFTILKHYSASVGHVVKILSARNPSNTFMIKIIKPLAISQSCWEYKILHNIFNEGSCEKAFVVNMLKSIGKELNVFNEIANINQGFKLYTASYTDLFSADIDVKLTTVENIPGIIRQTCWFAMTMTIAPGIPLSKLVENNLINNDTRYRARLHRCLDILVYKFFYNIVNSGFYHGDLHAGNIFYSYEDSQVTLIDFGAVGELNIYSSDSDIRALLEIVVMSIFYNYDGILDKLTDILNNKCLGSTDKINKNDPKYISLKTMLHHHKIKNIMSHEKEKKLLQTYERDIFSEKRIQDEKPRIKKQIHKKIDPSQFKSIYDVINYQPQLPPIYESELEELNSIVIENKEILPKFTEILGDSENINFPGVLELIIKYYALSGTNIAVKFSEFSEFQKAYGLLLGVLSQVNYSSYRSSIIMGKAIKNWKNIKNIRHIGAIKSVITIYLREKKLFKQSINDIISGKYK